MEIIVLKSNLKEGLGILGKISSETTSLPVLRNFLLETVDNKLKFSATNLEFAITSYVPAKIIHNGSLTIPLSVFSSIISNLQNERITLEGTEATLQVKTENYNAKIQGVKKEEFPIIPEISNGESSIVIESGILKDALTAVMSAAATNATRPELNGILFDYQINFVKLAATDSFRLAEYTINQNYFNSEIDKKIKVIIPLKTIQEVLRVLSDKDDNKISISFDQNQVLFKSEKFEIISRLINGNFPDYQSIIPTNLSSEFSVNKDQFVNAIRLTGSFSDKFNEVKLIIKDGVKNVELSSSNPLLGENQYLIAAKIKGEPIQIVFNWRFLLDGLKSISSNSVNVGLQQSEKPAIINSPDDPNFLYILVPIKGS